MVPCCLNLLQLCFILQVQSPCILEYTCHHCMSLRCVTKDYNILISINGIPESVIQGFPTLLGLLRNVVAQQREHIAVFFFVIVLYSSFNAGTLRIARKRFPTFMANMNKLIVK